MTLPSSTLLLQSVLSGMFTGGLYGLLGLGVGLSWGLLRQINLAHFALAFLSAYLCYQATTSWGLDPLLGLVLLPPIFFVIGAALHLMLSRFSITPLNSLLVTFSLTVMIEALIQHFWTADFRKMQTHYADMKFKIGELFVPIPELLTLILAVALSLAMWVALRTTDWGKAVRAMAEDAPIAAAYGIDEKRQSLILAGLCTALASIGGVCLALSFTLTPAQIYAWVGVVFAVVMLGGLRNPLGPLIGGLIIGVSEAITMTLTAPSWAPIVSFSLLIIILLFRR